MVSVTAAEEHNENDSKRRAFLQEEIIYVKLMNKGY